MSAYSEARELDILNSACCRVKGVELVAGDILDDNFPSLAGATVTMPDGSVKTLREAAAEAMPLMRAMLPVMREALKQLQSDCKRTEVTSGK